jgi:hypothetical protein
MSRFEFDPFTREPFPQGDQPRYDGGLGDPSPGESLPSPRDADDLDERVSRLVHGTPYGVATECARD